MEKLTVTLEDRPVDIELAQYKRMFEAACSALAAIGDALGVDPEEGGAEPILAAIADLKASDSRPVKQEPVAWHLDAETAKFLADMITADDEPTEITLRLGFIRDDDGKVQYGLLVEDSEYPEEGAYLLVECEPLNAAPVSAKRELVELTDDDINKCVYATFEDCPTSAERKLVSAVIAAFKEKNK